MSPLPSKSITQMSDGRYWSLQAEAARAGERIAVARANNLQAALQKIIDQCGEHGPGCRWDGKDDCDAMLQIAREALGQPA